MINCRLICHSNSIHLAQIYTGFALLHSAREIGLSQECRNQNFLEPLKPQHLRDARHAHLLVIVNDSIKLYYDCHDSHEIDESAVNEVDCYFKRSYAQSTIEPSLKEKVHPLGLNYPVFPAECDNFERERLSTFATQSSPQPVFRPTVKNMQAVPNNVRQSRALFITRAWDPADNADRSSEKMMERVQLNETRARCIELLRQQFGDRFLGGFIHTDYAQKNYQSALLLDERLAAKENYVKLLSRYPVCIATTGLHGSTGWKMGEYVAFSRAIVSEKLNYQVPGDFLPSENYLEFDDPKRCADEVHRLLSDAALRQRLMKTNHQYYLSYLRPDSMIRRTLDIALSEGGNSGLRLKGHVGLPDPLTHST